MNTFPYNGTSTTTSFRGSIVSQTIYSNSHHSKIVFLFQCNDNNMFLKIVFIKNSSVRTCKNELACGRNGRSTLRGSRVCGKTPGYENGKVIPIRTTQNSSSMLLCTVMRCIVTPKYPRLWLLILLRVFN